MTDLFTSQQAQALQEFLAESHRPDGTLSYGQLAGFLFAVCCSPELVQADDWMSVIFDDQDPSYFNEKEDKQVQSNLVALYQWVRQGVAEQQSALPPLCQPAPSLMDNFKPAAGLSQWCQGFLIGHDWLEEVWNDYLAEDQDEALGECMMTLSFFASKELAVQWQKELGTPKNEFPTLLQEQIDSLADAMRRYADLGRQQQAQL